ncbi:MAG: hypothetical protein QW625_02105 [Candidatus Nanoarchaeia archaeon]
MKRNLEQKIVNQIFKIIDEESKKFFIEKDYVWVRLFSSSDYAAVIKIVKDKKPIKDKKFLESISYRLYRELGIKKVSYDFVHNKGKYQKLHY